LAVDGLESLEKAIDEVQTEIAKVKTDDVSLARYLGGVRLQFIAISQVKEKVASISRAWEDLRDQTHQQERDSLNSALKFFETETVSPMSIQERAVYIERLDQWLGERLDQIYRHLLDCKAAARDAKFEMQSAIKQQTSELRRLLDGLRAFQAKRQPQDTPLVFINSYPLEASSVPRGCEEPAFLEVTRPMPPDPGLGLGPFRWISSWLVSTKSLALVLITGMLGFGLLGATISSFLRRDVNFASVDPVPGELGGVVIRGLSAAVIVFLAVKGGLAAYAVGETEPNAYVLFFTCLLGAAFSDRVWKWAQAKLEDQLPEEGLRKEKGSAYPKDAGEKAAENKGAGPHEGQPSQETLTKETGVKAKDTG
jgi:hypothetical protein